MICSFHSKFPTQNPPRSTQKNPFYIQIKHDTTYNFTFCRRLADEGDSKSLVLITRVGSTPTTGIKRKLPQTSWGSFLFYLRRVRCEQHTHTLPKKASRFCRDVSFLYAVHSACAGSSVLPYSALAGSVFCRPYL